VLHVPLIVVAPGLEPRRVASLVPASVSIGATILDLAGISEHDLPGPSLAGVAAGGALGVDAVVSETRRKPVRGRGHVRSLTTPSEKLIHWITEERYELFNLDTDRNERRPTTDALLTEQLAGALTDWAGKHASKASITVDKVREPAPKDGAEQRDIEEQLKALGYLD
jgi:hypothetical protein